MSSMVCIMARPRDKSEYKHCQYCGEKFYRDRGSGSVYWENAKYCTRMCAGKGIGISKRATPETMRKRFFANVEKEENGCWAWVGATRDDGRGSISISGKTMYAHHLSLTVHGRPLPKGLMACHKCHNRNCVNPDHLYHGTAADNSRDAVLAGRIHWRKLTEEQVLEIRASRKTGAELARTYGVTASAIAKIRKRITWKHV